jgi:hypothetical protein
MVAGAAVGYEMGNTALGTAIGGMIGGVVGGMLFPVAGPDRPDLNVSTSTYGMPVQTVYGTTRISGNCFWATTLNQHNPSGKGGQSATGPTYTCSFAVGLCGGPISDVLRIWADGKLIYDKTNTLQIVHAISKFNFVFRVYLGTEDQLPDYLITDWCAANVSAAPNAAPAYRGLAYVIFDNIRLDDFANRIPSITAEVVAPADVSFAQVMPATIPAGNASSFGQVSNLTPDINNEYAYQAVDGGIAVWDLVANTLVRIVPASDIYVGADRDDPKMAITNMAFLAVGGTGTLYLNPWNSGRIVSISTGAMKQNDSLGTYFFSFGATDMQIWNRQFLAVNTDPETSTLLPWIEDLGTAYGITVVSIIPGIPGITDEIIGAFVSLVSAEISPVVQGVMGLMGALSMFATPVRYVDFVFVNAGNSILILDGSLNYMYGDSEGSNYIPMPYQTFGTTQVCNANPGSMTSVFKGPIAYVVNSSAYGGNVYLYAVWYVTLFPLYFSSLAHIMDGASLELMATIPASVFSWSTMVVRSVTYDPSDNRLIFYVQGTNGSGATAYMLFKWDVDSSTMVWSTAVSAFNNATPAAFSSPYAGMIGFGEEEQESATPFFLYSTTDGSLKWQGAGSPQMATTGPTYYVGVTNSLVITTPGGVVQAQLDTAEAQPTNLAGIVTDICVKSGIAATQIDVSLLTQPVAGYSVDKLTPGSAVLGQLCATYFIDVVESDYKLKFVPRGSAPVANIVQDDLAPDSAKSDDVWTNKRTQDVELPYFVTFDYADSALDYQRGSAYAKRISGPVNTTWSKAKVSVKVPIVMDDTLAAQTAQKILYTAWQERNAYSTTLGWQYLWLDPGDVVTVSLTNGDVYTVRFTTIETGADFTMKCDTCGEDSATYSSTVQGGATSFIPQGIVGVVYANFYVFNVPLLEDSDAPAAGSTILYYGAGAHRAGWTSGAVLESSDGTTYDQVGTLGSSVVWGTAANALGDTTAKFSLDVVNTVTIALGFASETLSSITDDQLTAWGNMAILGQEVIQFRDVTVNGDGTVTLSALLRGRRGTDWATDTHSIGDTFVLVDPTTMSGIATPASEIGTAEYWELVSSGLNAESVAPYAYRNLGYPLMPYAPLNHTRATSGGNLVVGWSRRTRLSGEMTDGTGVVPLMEDFEQYDAYVLAAPFDPYVFNAGTPSTFVRAYTGLTSPTFTYAAADMATDGFNPATSTLHLVVFQVSSVVGPGFPGWSDMLPC